MLEVKNDHNRTNDRIVSVSTFGNRSDKIKKIINQHWSLVSDEMGTTELPLFAFKRGRNVRDLVVSSSLRTTPVPDLRAQLLLPPLVAHFKCGHCKACELTVEQKDFCHPGQRFTLKHHTNCITKDVVYIIMCPCNKVYI